MSLKPKTVFVIECDQCHTEYKRNTSMFDTLLDMLSEAANEGWLIYNTITIEGMKTDSLCPKCRKK